MGVQIKDILDYSTINLKNISNKKISVDTFNMLYQFLASIRQSDGNPLTDENGDITSHLKGLFYRCVYFKKNNIKAVFIFDGKAPKLKEKERELRQKKREVANEKYKHAIEIDNKEDMKKYAQSLSRLDEKMIKESKQLIEYFGFPIIEAPSEGEAQAAFMSKKGYVWAAASQDFDSLLFGTKYLIKNLSLSTKRKVPGTSTYRDVDIEFFDLEENLKKLNINEEEFVILAILCGTDFNPGGIKGVGPKTALKLVREYRNRWDDMFKILDWHSYFPYTWIEVFNTFRKMPITKDIGELKFQKLQKKEIIDMLIKKGFEEKHISNNLNSIKIEKTLDSFF